MRSKSVIILEALLSGSIIKFPNDNHSYVFQDGIFGVLATKTKTDDPNFREEIVLGVDYSLSYFVKLCEKFTEDEVFIIGCEKVLKEWNVNRCKT